MLPLLGVGTEAQSAAARELGVNQSTISRLLSKDGKGGSVQLAQKVAEFLNESPSLILTGSADGVQARQLRELPGFAAALGEAKARLAGEHPGIGPGDLEIAANTRAIPEPPRVTAGLLIHIALARHLPPPSNTQHKRPRRRT
jgi:transcriptional regulator with XRE-family HTH domain